MLSWDILKFLGAVLAAGSLRVHPDELPECRSTVWLQVKHMWLGNQERLSPKMAGIERWGEAKSRAVAL